jgi:hypothetical protein
MANTTPGLLKRNDLDKLRESLRDLPAQTLENKPELTVKEVVTLLKSELVELREKKNYSLQQLREHLATHGVTIALPTLRSYLEPKRRKRGDGTKAEAA